MTHNYRNILCIRLDNMGDLLMSSPAIAALKETFGAKITVLTSAMAVGVANLIDEIDEVMVYNVPWVKTNEHDKSEAFYSLVEQIRERQFDAAVIFTVYSQSPLPAAMLTYLAGIPVCVGYCRENPYQLINHWVPDKEPYEFIRHQVRRDLDLVSAIGAKTASEHLRLNVPDINEFLLEQKLREAGVNEQQPWLILHPGVSEPKREYPVERWIEAGRRVIDELGYQLLITGAASEKSLAEEIAYGIGTGAFPVAGLFNLNEFIVLVARSPILVSVNTGTIHIAAALGVPTVVLYALTNPQHTPWQVPCKVLPFEVPVEAQSRNEVIVHVNKYFSAQQIPMPCVDDVLNAVKELLAGELQHPVEIQAIYEQ
ncbi:glycosyltransferase family 9 protein [Mucilaginibacter sp. RS28]|uniref:Glycosyltransferase family 9 protein n=1 Tax=Mucilaginibacter straminoryzae TaxID=2932774 RepID=A0A9X1WZW1_9SPHI|nr:glycosyltransferase family 9 protein [Mucilaginibacter straminoryzae]MCJ8208687.1 glycosyltransferase family 9 protein [Mucilaginibacter straminoryzae]